MIGNIEICAPDDATVIIKKNGDILKEITGTKFKIYLDDEKTLIVECDGKRYSIRFKQPLVQTSK